MEGCKENDYNRKIEIYNKKYNIKYKFFFNIFYKQ